MYIKKFSRISVVAEGHTYLFKKQSWAMSVNTLSDFAAERGVPGMQVQGLICVTPG